MVEHVGATVEADAAEPALVRTFVGVDVVVVTQPRHGREPFVRTNGTLIRLQVHRCVLRVYVELVLGPVRHHLATFMALEVEMGFVDVRFQNGGVLEDHGAVRTGVLLGAVVLAGVYHDVAHALPALVADGQLLSVHLKSV